MVYLYIKIVYSSLIGVKCMLSLYETFMQRDKSIKRI